MSNLKISGMIFLLALALRLPGIFYPERIVFDEVAGVTYGLHWLYGKAYFDVHPPLLNMLYASVAKLAGSEFQNKIETQDKDFGDYPYKIIRSLVAIVGSIVPVLVFAIALQLTNKRLSSFLVGMAAALDNGLVVFSRFIFPDMWLLALGLAAVFLAMKKKSILTGIFLAAVLSVKWTGLGFWLLAIMFGANKKSLVIGIIGYILIWVIFFVRLGPGAAFSGIEAFSDRLSYPGPNLVEIIRYLPRHHMLMLRANDIITNHESASNPLSWFLGQGKIVLDTNNNRAIVFRGNVLGWWSVVAAVVIGLFLAVKNSKLELFILGFAANLIPFFFLERVFFLYHYLPALVIGYMVLAYVLAKINLRFKAVWLVGVVICFIAVAPVTYGWDVPSWWRSLGL